MENRDFDEFVKRQRTDAAALAIDWSHERDEWLGYLSQLYKSIERLLGTYLSSRQIRLEYKPIEINEENIGAYAAEEMILRIGRQVVSIKPIGTLLIGFKGRVDVEGPVGRRQIALVDSKAWGVTDLVRVSVSGEGRLPHLPKKKLTDEQKVAKVEHKLDAATRGWVWRIVTPPPERRFIEITQQSLFDLILDVASV